MVLYSLHVAFFLRRNQACDLGLVNFVRFPNKIERNQTHKKFRVRFCSIAEHTRIQSKFCSVLTPRDLQIALQTCRLNYSGSQ